MNRRILGRYIVADDAVCHGQLTIRGTRILVADVLWQIGNGWNWDRISADWGGKVPHEALTEIVNLSRQAFLDHVEEHIVETVLA